MRTFMFCGARIRVPGFPLRQHRRRAEDTDPKSQIPKDLGGGGGDLADFRFRVSDFLGSESRKLAQIQKSKASRTHFLGSRQISWDVRFQISDFRFPSGPGQIPWAESDFRFQISKGPAADFYDGQISDFRFPAGPGQLGQGHCRFQISDFQLHQIPKGSGAYEAECRFQISGYKNPLGA